MKRLLTALAASVIATCQTAAATPFCPELGQTDMLPKTYQKRGPFYSDPQSGWILGADQLKSDFKVGSEAAALLREIARAFDAAGTQLVVLSAPPRPLFVPDAALADAGVPDSYRRAAVSDAFGEYIASLNAAGIVAPDLRDIAKTDAGHAYYFHRDTHWTPYGAFLSAAALAQRVTSETVPAPAFDARYSEKGSLSAVAEAVCGARPAPETVPQASYAKTGALLGDTGSQQIALVGTSFSDRYKRDAYQVADALAHAFKADVVNVSLTGGGMTGSMIAFLSDPRLDLSTFDYVVWESPYTAPLTQVAGLRHVLGHLKARAAQDTLALADTKISENWEHVRTGFDAAHYAALRVTLPGVTVGAVSLELIAKDGSKHRYKLTKSKRVPQARRTEVWTLALDGLPQKRIERFKIKVSDPKGQTVGALALLR